jgi:hypothetical protein
MREPTTKIINTTARGILYVSLKYRDHHGCYFKLKSNFLAVFIIRLDWCRSGA